MKKHSLHAVLFALALVLAACGQSMVDPVGETDTTDSQIINGDVDHAHSSVGKIRMSGQDICTGTLIGKRTVLCAAHCIMKSASAYSFIVGGKQYQARSIVVNPDWDRNAEGGEGINDLSVILLDAAPAVTPSAIATTSPRVGENLTLVGYGITSTEGDDFGTRRVSYNSIYEIASTKIYWLPQNGIGTTCYGDSGGPAFAKVGNEEVQVGITSGGQSPCETGYSWDTRVDLFASWIKSVAKGDVVLQGHTGSDQPAAADTEKPRVHISSPASQTDVAVGTVTVKASVTDNVGVTRAELWLDGAKLSTRSAAPYNFSAKLSRGTHQLRVYGYDAAGNEGHYTVTVTAR